MYRLIYGNQLKKNLQKLKKDLSKENFFTLAKRLDHSLDNLKKYGLRGLTLTGVKKINNKEYLIYEQCLTNDNDYKIYIYIAQYKKDIIVLDIGELKEKTNIIFPS